MTIVELLISLVIISIILVSFVASLISAYRTSFERKTQLELDSANQNAMEIIERDIRFSKLFNTKVLPPFTDTFGPELTGTWTTSNWSYAGNPASAGSRVLILSQNATDLGSLSGMRSIIYQTVPNGCAGNLHLNDPLEFRIIYFMRSNTLYRRILTDNTSLRCGGGAVAQRQSCPPDASAGLWDPTICKARDEIMAKEVSAFRINYYANIADAAPITTQYTGTAQSILNIAEVAEITLELSRPFSGNTISSTQTLKIAKVNR